MHPCMRRACSRSTRRSRGRRRKWCGPYQRWRAACMLRNKFDNHKLGKAKREKYHFLVKRTFEYPPLSFTLMTFGAIDVRFYPKHPLASHQLVSNAGKAVGGATCNEGSTLHTTYHKCATPALNFPAHTQNPSGQKVQGGWFLRAVDPFLGLTSHGRETEVCHDIRNSRMRHWDVVAKAAQPARRAGGFR